MSRRIHLSQLVVVLGCLIISSQAMALDYQVSSAFEIVAEPACGPAITRAPNGDLVMAFSTEWEPFPAGGMVKLTVSSDNGQTWSQPQTIWQDSNPDVGLQVFNGMQTLSNGDILLPIGYSIVPKFDDVDPGETRPWFIYDLANIEAHEVRMLRSTDNGQTWTREDPQLPSFTGSFGRLLETTDGRLIRGGYEGWIGEAWYNESTDFGHTWGPKHVIEGGDNETNIVEAADGSMFIIERAAGNPQFRIFGSSFSYDGGDNWTAMQSNGIQGKMPDTLVLDSGRILMAVGAEGLSDGSQIVTETDRYSFCTLFISDDHGQTWRRDVEFEQVIPGSSIVPADGPGLVLLDDGRILAVSQAIDRSLASDPLFGYSAGMTVIGNIIVVTPEPMTLSVLVIGGFAALLRRKR